MIDWLRLNYHCQLAAIVIYCAFFIYNVKLLTLTAWKVINSTGSSPLDAVEKGCTACEVARCDGTVGYGGR